MKKINYLNPFGRMCISMGMIPSTYKESLTYEEQLLWLLNYLEKTVIPTVNGNAEATEELQKYYEELKQYVDDYFTDLNVQEQINNKLDAMAESGELEEIISIYLNSKSIICFDTVADLKASTALQDGSYARTLGYYSVNDGGGSLYKISDDTLTADDGFIIALDNGLYASLIVKDKIYPEQIGCKGDNTFDNRTKFQSILAKNLNITFLSNKTYLISDVIVLNANTILDLNNSTLNSASNHTLYNFSYNTTATGYNGNGNLTIKNGKIKGGCVSLFHARNVLIENVRFIECRTNHNIELCACRDVTIRNCVFDIPTNDVEYIESINIDPCTHDSFPWANPDSATYDGTNNYNIDIYGCLFHGGNSYLIRDGVGAHTDSVNHHRLINVHDNNFINMGEDGVRLFACDLSKVYNNTIVSAVYGISLYGSNNELYNNNITSERDSDTYVIRILENTYLLSEYNNVVYANSHLEKRHILLSANKTCTFLKVDNVSLNPSKTFSSDTVTITTDSRYNLSDFNKLSFCIGSPSDGTFAIYEINSFYNEKFVVDNSYYIPELDLTAQITGNHEIQIVSSSNINLRDLIAHVE